MTFLSIYEKQVEQYLSSIILPEDYQQVVLEAYRREDEQSSGFDNQRHDLENKLKRLKQLYTWGDLSLEEYRVQRDQLRGELAALPAATSSKKETLERLAIYLQNVGEAWRNANQEQRNRLAKVLFEGIRIEDRTIKGVTPQIEFTPLLVLSDYQKKNLHPECQDGGRKCGSDGVRTLMYDTLKTRMVSSTSSKKSVIHYFRGLRTGSMIRADVTATHLPAYLRISGQKSLNATQMAKALGN